VEVVNSSLECFNSTRWISNRGGGLVWVNLEPRFNSTRWISNRGLEEEELQAVAVSTPHGGLATRIQTLLQNETIKVSTPHGGLAT